MQEHKTSKILNKMETINLLGASQNTFIRMFNDLNKNFNKEIGKIKIEIENIRKNQSDMKDN